MGPGVSGCGYENHIPILAQHSARPSFESFLCYPEIRRASPSVPVKKSRPAIADKLGLRITLEGPEGSAKVRWWSLPITVTEGGRARIDCGNVPPAKGFSDSGQSGGYPSWGNR